MEINKTNLVTVTNSAYLKELVDPKVWMDIDGLPFITEGYEKVKNILVSKYGETNEIVNMHVMKVVNLPVTTGTRSANIHDFSRRSCTYNVQSLETQGVCSAS